MPRRHRWAVLFWTPGGALLLATLLLPSLVFADAPMLAIHVAEGESQIYVVSEIERIQFEGDESLVVVTAGGSDNYPTDSIVRIEFLWGPAGVENPRDTVALIKTIRLFQNLPNPFSPETRIGFELPHAGEVDVEIYGPNGRLVRTLVSEERGAGHHEVYWDGRNDSGRKVSSGVYFYSLKALGIEESRRMILLP